MGFQRNEVSRLLAACHRRCCICHRFCGVKIETDHIDPAGENGSDSIENAIPVCFECHAEIHSYNDNHPRGRKFQPLELQLHKAQWLEICRSQPDMLIGAVRTAHVGPLQALIDELEFNAGITKFSFKDMGCKFVDNQFLRAIHEGSISILKDEIRRSILDAYLSMGAANSVIESATSHMLDSEAWARAVQEGQKRIFNAAQKIQVARDELLKFLSSD